MLEHDDDTGCFAFTYRDELGNTTTKTFSTDYWMEAAEQFKSFLLGCGFRLQEGSIIIKDPYDFASQLDNKETNV